MQQTVYYCAILGAKVDPFIMDQSGFEWTPDFWRNWRESKNPYRQYKSDRDRRLALELLRLRAGDRILEVGCGYGWISQVIWDAAKVEWY
ncbi:MAG: hypothetical protein WBD66_13550, partial [Candidatus Acidiferrales bacterium]